MSFNFYVESFQHSEFCVPLVFKKQVLNKSALLVNVVIILGWCFNLLGAWELKPVVEMTEMYVLAVFGDEAEQTMLRTQFCLIGKTL